MQYKNLSIKALALLAELKNAINVQPEKGFGAEELRTYGDEAKAELLNEGVLICVPDGRYQLSEH